MSLPLYVFVSFQVFRQIYYHTYRTMAARTAARHKSNLIDNSVAV